MFKYILSIVFLSFAASALSSPLLSFSACPAEDVSCEIVWANVNQPVSQLKVSSGQNIISTNFKPFSELDYPSKVVIFLSLDLGPNEVKTAVKDGLNRFIKTVSNSTQLMVWQATDELSLISALGKTKEQTARALRDIDFNIAAQNQQNFFNEVVNVAKGGHQHRTLFLWLTTDASLMVTNYAVRDNALLSQDNTRLVVVHIDPSELVVNDLDKFQLLASSGKGLYEPTDLETLPQKMESLASYITNGGELRFPAQKRCGELTYSFLMGEENINVLQNLAPCEQATTNEPQAPSSETPPSTEEQSGEGESNVPRNEPQVPSSEQSETTTPDTENQPSEETEPVIDSSEDSEEPNSESTDTPTSDNSPMPNDDTESSAEEHQNVLIVMAALLVAILIVVIVLFMGRRKKVSSDIGEPYATLIDTNTQESFSISKDVSTIGRDEKCDIMLLDDSVSRGVHAIFKRQAGQIKIIDSGSTNGTKVNGKKIESSKISHGDIIQFGEQQLRVQRLK